VAVNAVHAARRKGTVLNTFDPDNLPEGVEFSELGGLRVVTESMPSVRSVTAGLWVRTGSRDEGPGEAGLSHFLEHLLFKGVEGHTASEISEIFDGMGALTNAATSKESTHLHARFVDRHLDEAFALLSEMMLRPTLPADEIDPEREVVLEEIAMYEDEPSDRVHDLLAEAIYGDHPLGRRVLGEAEVIAGTPRDEIAAYHRAHYTVPNLVVGVAGNVEHARVVELVNKHFQAPDGDPVKVEDPAPPVAPRMLFRQKQTEQFHICFGGHGISRHDDRRYALALLDSIFGGATSSRLFREVREKRGLAYSVGSYTQQNIDHGSIAMYVGTRPENVDEVCRIIGSELESIRTDGVTGEELERAKENLKGRIVLSLESSASRMSRISRAALFDVPLEDLDETIARIDAVSHDEVRELASDFYDPAKLSAAAIGADADVFARAVEAVSPTLCA